MDILMLVYLAVPSCVFNMFTDVSQVLCRIKKLNIGVFGKQNHRRISRWLGRLSISFKVEMFVLNPERLVDLVRIGQECQRQAILPSNYVHEPNIERKLRY